MNTTISRSNRVAPSLTPTDGASISKEAGGDLMIMVSPKPTAAEIAQKLERKRIRRIKRIKKRPYIDELESLQGRYRARRLHGKATPITKPKPYVDDYIEFEPKKKTLVQRITQAIEKPKPVTYELSPEAVRATKALALTRRQEMFLLDDGSKFFLYSYPPLLPPLSTLPPWLLVRMLHQIRKLKKKYMEIDVERYNQISRSDFWEAMNVKRSAFTDKIFDMIDSDDSGKIDFSEFVCILVTFCCFNKDDVLRFSFDCFDADHSGKIDMLEVEALVDMMQSQEPMFTTNIDDAMHALRSDGDGQIDFLEFRSLNQRYPLMLQPAFRLQNKLHMATLGASDWVKIMENLNHAARQKDAMKARFGMAAPTSAVRTVAAAFGFARWYPRVDDDYINSKRPSLWSLYHDLDDEQRADRQELMSAQSALDEEKRAQTKESFSRSIPSLLSVRGKKGGKKNKAAEIADGSSSFASFDSGEDNSMNASRGGDGFGSSDSFEDSTLELEN